MTRCYRAISHDVLDDLRAGKLKRLWNYEPWPRQSGETYAPETVVFVFTDHDEAGIESQTIDNSAAYIASWLGKLQGDAKLVIYAAAQAQRAVDHILNREAP